ncbi:ethanolamine kinase 1-like, partial [Diceros bicornis minor]|uniref:ethanolamine kinase 1-like n=1 Tax=Diceros bicornis minor TaxID=77932 RepID=UPI0026EF2254
MLRGRRRSSADERNFPREEPGVGSAAVQTGSARVPLQPFSYRSPVSLNAPCPPARAPRDGRIHQPVGARRSRGRRRRRRCDSLCRRVG